VPRLLDGDPEQRKLFAKAALTIRTAEETPEEGDSSDDEPQDTTEEVAVEHSEEDTETPQATDVNSAGQHESASKPETPDADERLFADALTEVRAALELNPPMKEGKSWI